MVAGGSHLQSGYLVKVQPSETHLLYLCQFGNCVFVSLYFMGVFLSYHIKNMFQIGSIWQKYICSNKNTPRKIDITDKYTSNHFYLMILFRSRIKIGYINSLSLSLSLTLSLFHPNRYELSHNLLSKLMVKQKIQQNIFKVKICQYT